jgi:hypothetical protein
MQEHVMPLASVFRISASFFLVLTPAAVASIVLAIASVTPRVPSFASAVIIPSSSRLNIIADVYSASPMGPVRIT